MNGGRIEDRWRWLERPESRGGKVLGNGRSLAVAVAGATGGGPKCEVKSVSGSTNRVGE